MSAATGRQHSGRAAAGHPRLRFPIRPVRGRWPGWIDRRGWPDPASILDAEATEEDFAEAIGAVELGGTFKMTFPNRHPDCDGLLFEHVDLAGATILDVGASDGTTSVDLVRRLPSGFASYVIADRYLSVHAVEVLGHTLLFDPDDGQCILAFGRRSLAWPHRSRAVHLVYAPLLGAAALRRRHRREVSLLNPRARALVAEDRRVTVRTHDVFRPWDGPTPDVIKVANLLRRIYFSDEEILQALEALRQSLDEGGYLLVVDDPYLPIAPRAGLYRRQGDRFQVVALTDEVPEINDLVLHDDPDAAVGRQEVS